MRSKGENKAPAMERFGLWYLKKLNAQKPPERIDIKTYILDKDERRTINRIERKAIVNVVIAGALSSIVSGLAAFWLDPYYNESISDFTGDNLFFWSIVIGTTVLASLIEIIYIYYDVMAKTHALCYAAHMELFPKNLDEEFIAAPIVRAALELPNKKEKDIRIDPDRESSKVLILVATLFYKLKVSVSNFVLKALVKRMLGRAISRAWLNFLSVPVCAFWNGLVCWFVIREVKIRVLGPSAVHEILSSSNTDLDKMSQQGKIGILRAIGSSIVRTADLHPNLEYMFRSFDKKVKQPRNAIFDDTFLFLDELKKLPDHEKKTVLKILVYASILDGKINYREKKLLRQAYEICGMNFNFNTIRGLLKRFRRGQLLEFNLERG